MGEHFLTKSLFALQEYAVQRNRFVGLAHICPPEPLASEELFSMGRVSISAVHYGRHRVVTQAPEQSLLRHLGRADADRIDEAAALGAGDAFAHDIQQLPSSPSVENGKVKSPADVAAGAPGRHIKPSVLAVLDGEVVRSGASQDRSGVKASHQACVVALCPERLAVMAMSPGERGGNIIRDYSGTSSPIPSRNSPSVPIIGPARCTRRWRTCL